jgi:hypothetical protein
MTTKTFYVQVETEIDESFSLEEFSSELLDTCVYVELSEDEGFEGVVRRVASRPF